MNKKRLSVVMAGAMLASSVAPVLAAEVQKSEVSAAQLGLLKKELRETLESKTFHSTDVKAGESVYYVTNGLTGDKVNTVAGLDSFIADLKAGDKVYVWSEGFRTDEKGNYFSTTKAEEKVVGTYKKSDFTEKTENAFGKANDATKLTKQINDECWVAANAGTIRKYLVEDSGENGVGYYYRDNSAIIKLANGREIVLNEGSEILDFTKPIDKDGYEVKIPSTELVGANYAALSQDTKDKLDNVVGFASKKTVVDSDDIEDLASEKLKEITITSGGNNLTVDELYDGLMLTEKGHDLLNEIKYYDKVDGKTNPDSVTIGSVKKVNGQYTFTVEFKAIGALSKHEYVISGTNEANAKKLNEWLTARLAKVDILAGSNRYETAVAIAKEQALKGNNLGGSDVAANIVLVNGNSLVDGLSAAPLAAKLRLHKDAGTAAPILLTEADELPKATKAYLKELVANKTINNLNTTIHLVGGTSVLTKSLERELKDLGFKVERYGGDNREETSLEVAKAIGNTSSAFVVGAEGEADAMSIAAVASTDLDNNWNNGTQTTPIIVSKKGGLTEDAIDALKDVNATIIGGENAVSKADYEAVKEEANSVNRIAGSNRQATNALIIEKYYSGSFAGSTKNVIVAKDGQKNKAELIDALAAANMASNKKAPIVLATNKLSTAQINALELNAKDAATLYQVGNGVARDVVKTIAQRLGLAN